MAQKVIWLTDAQVTFDAEIKYLEENFSKKDALAFWSRAQEKIEIIASHPQSGILSGKCNVYKTVVNKE